MSTVMRCLGLLTLVALARGSGDILEFAPYAGGTDSSLLRTPEDIVCDDQGNVLVADMDAGAILKISPAGVVSIHAKPLDAAGQEVLLTPSSVARTTDGTLYVGNQSGAIFRVSPDGKTATTIAQDVFATALEVGPDGTVYFCDGAGNRVRKITPAGEVVTIAGVTTETGAVDGQGAAARFSWTADVVYGRDGILYIADSNNGLIRKVTLDGKVTTLAQVAEYGVSGLAFDQAGNLLATDWSAAVINSVDPSGNIRLVAGAAGIIEGPRSGTPLAEFDAAAGTVTWSRKDFELLFWYLRGNADGMAESLLEANPGLSRASFAARFDVPCRLAVDGIGNVYVTDRGNANVRKIGVQRDVTTLAAARVRHRDGPVSSARFFGIQGLAFADNALFVADAKNAVVRRIANGQVSTPAGTVGRSGLLDAISGRSARLGQPYGLAVGPDSRLYVADAAVPVLRTLDDGEVSSVLCLNGTGPTAVAFDGAGNAYLTDSLNFLIWKVPPTGLVSVVAGSTRKRGFADGRGEQATFSYLWGGILADPDGTLYVSDTGNHAIRRISPDGTVTTLAGNGALGNRDGVGAAATLFNPSGLSFDANGDILVASTSSLRRVTKAGVTTTVATSLESGTTYPWNMVLTGVARDPAGPIYVADQRQDRILRGVRVPASRIANISIRAHSSAGSTPLIAGFVIDGSEPKSMLVRAVGPTLENLGVTNAYPDPGLALHRGNEGAIAANADWGGSSELQRAFAAAGAFPLLNDSRDAALISELPVGAYTAHLTGNQTGVALMEVYDLSPAANGRIKNVSARVDVGVGDNVLIAGISIAGTARKSILVRAVSGGLKQFGLGPAIFPVLKVTDQSSGRELPGIQNELGPELDDIFHRFGAFPVDNDSNFAFLAKLEPGTYSIQLSSYHAVGGIALLEIYDADDYLP